MVQQWSTMRAAIARYLRFVMLFVVITSLLGACTGPLTAPEPSSSTISTPARPSIVQFASDWAAGRIHDAAALTDDPAVASLLFGRTAETLSATALDITIDEVVTVDESTVVAHAELTWTLPIVTSWTYPVAWTWHANRSSDGEEWRLAFDPEVIHPDLGRQQSLVVRELPTLPGTVVDRYDVQLLQPTRVYSVVVLLDQVRDEAALSGKLAEILTAYDEGISAESIASAMSAARAAESPTYTAINLRADDFAAVETQLSQLSELSLVSNLRDLPPDSDFATALLSQAAPIATAMTHGEPGWRIVTIDATGDDLATIAEQPAEPGPKITLTIDPDIQRTAQQALADIADPAVLVGIEISTGEILAVAQNRLADKSGAIALTGQYPPGSIFKIVTAAAAIDAGVTSPSDTVDCPGSWTLDFRTIHNQDFALGKVPFHQAFAQSCNTTFAQLATQLSDDALPDAAAQFGIGVDFDVAGIITLTGAVQTADSALARAENGFGQGTDLVTPFSAALMAATAARGSMPTPILIRDTATESDISPSALSKDAAQALPELMRAVVTDGTARVLRDSGEVYAKTGTAEYVADTGNIAAHAWTVGYRDDIAFAALIVNGGSSQRTNAIIADFLAGVPQ